MGGGGNGGGFDAVTSGGVANTTAHAGRYTAERAWDKEGGRDPLLF